MTWKTFSHSYSFHSFTYFVSPGQWLLATYSELPVYAEFCIQLSMASTHFLSQLVAFCILFRLALPYGWPFGGYLYFCPKLPILHIYKKATSFQSDRNVKSD